MENKVGLTLSPCLTPDGQSNQSVGCSLRNTLALGHLYMAAIAEYISPTIPISFNLKSSNVLSTESKAFLKSTKAR